MSKTDAEVIVVGAGPGGASAAYHLAGLGRRVLLLDRQSFPRDKSCGDGLTRSSVRLLAEMGLLPQFESSQKVRGVRVFMKGKGSRDFEYPDDLGEPNHGLVVPRLELDNVICRRAVDAGADLWQRALVQKLHHENGTVVGVDVLHEGTRKRLRAPIVVAADGAASRLARQAGLVETSPQEVGFAIRAYFTDVDGLDELLEIYTPLMDPTDRYLLPSYGWVFPTGPEEANIGVGIFRRDRDVTVDDLFRRFLEQIRQDGSRFARIKQNGRWKGAPLRFDFAPERCVAPGLALVGDAAGLISPFTGEGISYALETGKFVAEVIDQNLARGATAAPRLDEYVECLRSRYSGYFETGRQSARRYLLVWHVLDSTFQNEKPLFATCRQAALFPEGIGESYVGRLLDDVTKLIPKQCHRVRADLVAVGEILNDTVRREWPFLARAMTSDQQTTGIPFRPALLLLLAGHAAPEKRLQMTMVGAAIELGYAAALAQLSVADEPPADAQREYESANWGNMFAMMVGDFLLSGAFQLSAKVSADVSREISETLSRACEGHIRQLRNTYNPAVTDAEYLAALTQKSEPLFEMPCRLGAQLSGCAQDDVRAFSDFGRHLGLAYQLAEESRDLQGLANQLAEPTLPDIREGSYGLPLLRAASRTDANGSELRRLLHKKHLDDQDVAKVRRLLLESDAVQETLDSARGYARQAQSALTPLPDSPERSALHRLADYAVTRDAQFKQ